MNNQINQISNELNILKAAHMYLSRQAGFSHPEGRRDNGSRFYPKGRDAEVMAPVRAPSRAYPWSYYKACLSLKHCAAYFDVEDLKAVRKAAKLGLLSLQTQIDQLEGRQPVAPEIELCEAANADWFAAADQRAQA